MFEHEFFDVYSFENIPLDEDAYLMDEIYMAEYEKSLLECFSGGPYEAVGYISYVGGRKVRDGSVELSWYPNIHTRFHELTISLPKEHFVTCIGSSRYDEKPHIFVDSVWLEQLYLKLYSVFCLIDAIGVKRALRNGSLYREKLVELRSKIDILATQHPNIAFISFADSLLLKSNWSVGHFRSPVKYTYEPELIIVMIEKLRAIYWATLGLDVYAIVTQGANEYYEDSLLHISESQNHVCLNSLGIPFAELMAIDAAASEAIKAGSHPPSRLYMDGRFYNSLSFDAGFDKHSTGKSQYRARMMSANGIYYYAESEAILKKLRR